MDIQLITNPHKASSYVKLMAVTQYNIISN